MVSIKLKIVLLFVCMIIASSFVIISAFGEIGSQMEASSKENIHLMAENEGKKLDIENTRIEESVRSMGNSIESSFDLNSSLENPEQYFGSYLQSLEPEIKKITENTPSSTGGYVYFNVETYKNVYDIWYIIENGTFIPSPKTETLEMFYPENENMVWYYGPMLSEKPFWTDIYFDDILKEKCVSYTMPVFVDGVKIGMVGMDVSFEKKEDLVRSIKIFDTGYAFVVDENGKYVVDPEYNISQDYTGEIINRSVYSESGIIDGGEYLISFSKLGNGHILSLIVPKNEVFQELNEFKTTSSIIGMLFLIVISITIYFFIGYVIGPLKKLRNSAIDAAKGNLNSEITIDTDDEIGELSSVFNNMLKSIRDAEIKIREQNKNLEIQVEERTKELEKRLKELGDTKTAILNMMEDSDDTNKNLLKTQKELSENLKKLSLLDKKKDEFISIAAHELKTPLTSIHGFSQLLLDKKIIENDEKRERYLKIIDKETKRLAKLVTDILDLSRIDLGTFKLNSQETDINLLLDDILKEMGIQAKDRGLKLEYDIQKKLPMIITDRERLTEILMNLINNSVKYTMKGSIFVRAFVEKNYIHFMIKDTGLGIAKENQKRIFERFFQVDSSATRQAGGTGLGLSISKEYVNAMGGEIWFSSEFGKGSEFHFTIPIKIKKNSD